MNLFALVKAGTNLLGTPTVRFFEFGTAPTLEVPPYATWQHLAQTPYNYLAGQPTLDHVKTQIDVWASSAQEAKAAALAVRRAIDTPCRIQYISNSWDEESLLYRVTLIVTYSQDI